MATLAYRDILQKQTQNVNQHSKKQSVLFPTDHSYLLRHKTSDENEILAYSLHGAFEEGVDAMARGRHRGGGEIRRIQRRRTTTSLATGRPNFWLEKLKTDSDVMLMMHGSDEIVLTVVIS